MWFKKMLKENRISIFVKAYESRKYLKMWVHGLSISQNLEYIDYQ